MLADRNFGIANGVICCTRVVIRSQDAGLEHIEAEKTGNEGRIQPGKPTPCRPRRLDAPVIHQYDCFSQTQSLALIMRDVDCREAEPVLKRLELHAHLL